MPCQTKKVLYSFAQQLMEMYQFKPSLFKSSSAFVFTEVDCRTHYASTVWTPSCYLQCVMETTQEWKEEMTAMHCGGSSVNTHILTLQLSKNWKISRQTLLQRFIDLGLSLITYCLVKIWVKKSWGLPLERFSMCSGIRSCRCRGRCETGAGLLPIPFKATLHRFCVKICL